MQETIANTPPINRKQKLKNNAARFEKSSRSLELLRFTAGFAYSGEAGDMGCELDYLSCNYSFDLFSLTHFSSRVSAKTIF